MSDHAGSENVFFEQRLYVPSYWRARAAILLAEARPQAMATATREVLACLDQALAVAAECGMARLAVELEAERSAVAHSGGSLTLG